MLQKDSSGSWCVLVISSCPLDSSKKAEARQLHWPCGWNFANLFQLFDGQGISIPHARTQRRGCVSLTPVPTSDTQCLFSWWGFQRLGWCTKMNPAWYLRFTKQSFHKLTDLDHHKFMVVVEEMRLLISATHLYLKNWPDRLPWSQTRLLVPIRHGSPKIAYKRHPAIGTNTNLRTILRQTKQELCFGFENLLFQSFSADAGSADLSIYLIS